MEDEGLMLNTVLQQFPARTPPDREGGSFKGNTLGLHGSHGCDERDHGFGETVTSSDERVAKAVSEHGCRGHGAP